MPCLICKVPSKGNYSLCLTCTTYMYYAYKAFSTKEIAVIGRNIYKVGAEESKPMFRGHAGRKFHIVFNDGTEVETTNLWDLGEVPVLYESILQDNAKFEETKK